MKYYVCITLAVLLTLCAGCAKQEETNVQSEIPVCQRTKLENQHIIHWKIQKPSLFISNEKYDLYTFVEKNKKQIDYVEPNYRLIKENTQLANPLNYVRPASSVHSMINTQYLWHRGYLGQNIIVAVIDTGVNLNHPQLKSHLAINEIESLHQNNGIDDDNNGFIDDIFGWNFVTNTALPIDEHGHGTAMAGLITGSSYNRPSLSMAPLAKILPVDFMNENGGTEFHAQQAMAYAISRKVNVINNSWSINCSQLLKDAFKSWRNENIIFVNAAGNSPVDVVLNEIVPSSLDLPNALNVGSLDEYGHRSSYSGFGNTVKIYAPGEFIPTIYPSSGLSDSIPISGTSVSAAVVSGAVALLWSAYPQATAVQIVNLVTESANQEPTSERVLDLKKAFLLGNNLFPRNLN